MVHPATTALSVISSGNGHPLGLSHAPLWIVSSIERLLAHTLWRRMTCIYTYQRSMKEIIHCVPFTLQLSHVISTIAGNSVPSRGMTKEIPFIFTHSSSITSCCRYADTPPTPLRLAPASQLCWIPVGTRIRGRGSTISSSRFVGVYFFGKIDSKKET